VFATNVLLSPEVTVETVPALSSCHDGIPLFTFNTLSVAPIASLAKDVVVFAYNISP
jgi:hypothetical protein